MRESGDKRCAPGHEPSTEGARAHQVDARLAELFRKQRQDALMEELRKALRSHLLSRSAR